MTTSELPTLDAERTALILSQMPGQETPRSIMTKRTYIAYAIAMLPAAIRQAQQDKALACPAPIRTT